MQAQRVPRSTREKLHQRAPAISTDKEQKGGQKSWTAELITSSYLHAKAVYGMGVSCLGASKVQALIPPQPGHATLL